MGDKENICHHFCYFCFICFFKAVLKPPRVTNYSLESQVLSHTQWQNQISAKVHSAKFCKLLITRFCKMSKRLHLFVNVTYFLVPLTPEIIPGCKKCYKSKKIILTNKSWSHEWFGEEKKKRNWIYLLVTNEHEIISNS